LTLRYFVVALLPDDKALPENPLMQQKFRCKHCHITVCPNTQHVCESTGGVYDEEDFLELVPATSTDTNGKGDAWDEDDDFPSTEEDHNREFD